MTDGATTSMPEGVSGTVFDIDSFAMHDGPGIRMAVYFKGCPLSCSWCHSPESQSSSPDLAFFAERCALCGHCVDICPRSCHSIEKQEHRVDRSMCVCCGQCVDACSSDALEIKGYAISSLAVVEKALRFKPYFDASGGGITLTGGEVTAQIAFALDILSRCKAQGIHTVVETCGACDGARIEALLPFVDLLFYDIKLIDDQRHQRWTGVSNRRILENASRLGTSGTHVQIRVPLIPGITDTTDNLDGIFEFMNAAGLRSIALLPYNTVGPAKYEWLGLSCDVQCTRQNEAHLSDILNRARHAGLDAVLG